MILLCLINFFNGIMKTSYCIIREVVFYYRYLEIKMSIIMSRIDELNLSHTMKLCDTVIKHRLLKNTLVLERNETHARKIT